MADPVELNALLPYLDGIFDNLDSDDDDAEVIEETDNDAVRMTRKQIPSLAPYSTKRQRRKKAELHALRTEGQQLAVRKERLLRALGTKKPSSTRPELPASCVERHK